MKRAIPFALAVIVALGCTADPGELLSGPGNTDPACSIASYLVTDIGAFPANFNGSWSAIHVDDGALIFQRWDDDQRRTVISKTVLESGEETVFPSTVGNDALLGVDGAVLYTRGELDTIELVHVAPSGTTSILDLGDGGSPFFSADSFQGGVLQTVDADEAVWMARSGLWRGRINPSSSRLVASNGIRTAALADGVLVFTESGDQANEVLFIQRSIDERPIALQGHAGAARHLSVDGNRVFYIGTGGAFVRYDFGADERTILDEGPCGPPSTNGGQAVAACQDGGEPNGPASPGPRLVFFDGVTTTVLNDGGYYHAPRIANGTLAWVWYSSPDVWCQGDAGKGAEIQFYDPTLSSDPITVASVGAPCLCCGALFPPAEIDFDGKYVAYNYAVDVTNPRTGGIRAARIDPIEVCE